MNNDVLSGFRLRLYGVVPFLFKFLFFYLIGCIEFGITFIKLTDVRLFLKTGNKKIWLLRFIKVFHKLNGSFIEKRRLVDLGFEGFLEPFQQLKFGKIYYILIFLVLYIVLVASLLLALPSHFFGCFSPYKLEVLLLSLAEKWIFEYETLILLFYLVKVIHVELKWQYKIPAEQRMKSWNVWSIWGVFPV